MFRTGPNPRNQVMNKPEMKAFVNRSANLSEAISGFLTNPVKDELRASLSKETYLRCISKSKVFDFAYSKKNAIWLFSVPPTTIVLEN